MTDITKDIEDAAGPLTQMGLTGYEAKVLVALLKLGRSTVREIYPICGVPRSAVYGVLERLRAKGLVHVASTRPTSYVSVSPAEVMEIMESDFERKKEGAFEVLSAIHTAPTRVQDEEEVWLLNDTESIVRMSRKLILSSKKEILLGVYPQRLAVLKNDILVRAIDGASVSLIAKDEADIPPDLRKSVNIVKFRNPERFAAMPELSLIIADGSSILFSMKHPLASDMENGFWSDSKALVSFFSFSLQISIKTKAE